MKYKQWINTPRTNLVDCHSSVVEFADLFCSKFDILRSHHYAAKAQSRYLTTLKEQLAADTAIVLMDFAENYSFVIQDATQGYHWDNSQATLHTFTAYIKDGDNVKNLNACVISDHLKHDTTAVQCYIARFLQYLLDEKPQIKKIHYYSDGAASQYKNFKNFANLLHHRTDFNLHAEWHFFATSHGKSPCDGIGGVTKRMASRASLQAAYVNHIRTPENLFNFADREISNVKYFWVPTEKVMRFADFYKLGDRYKKYKSITGTRMFHHFSPKSSNSIIVKRFSEDRNDQRIEIKMTVDEDELDELDFDDLNVDDYIACKYDANWYIGLITEFSREEGDFHVKFMQHSEKSRSFTWPTRLDTCWVPVRDVICKIPAPFIKGFSGRAMYKMNDVDYRKLLKSVDGYLKKK